MLFVVQNVKLNNDDYFLRKKKGDWEGKAFLL